jgi:hypothetical protein
VVTGPDDFDALERERLLGDLFLLREEIDAATAEGIDRLRQLAALMCDNAQKRVADDASRKLRLQVKAARELLFSGEGRLHSAKHARRAG